MTAASEGRYVRQFLAGWGAMDFNGHLANTAYLDLAADARLAFFGEHGFPASEFRRLGVGPVVRKDEIDYFREINLHDTVTVTCAVHAMSRDCSRFVLENEIWSPAGERACRVRSTGGWLDLRLRRLVEPPALLSAAFAKLPRTEDFIELSPISRRSNVAAGQDSPADETAV